MFSHFILQKTFSGIGLVMSCLGSVVGTGNIWRYPRIVAIHATGGGEFVLCLNLWCDVFMGIIKK